MAEVSGLNDGLLHEATEAKQFLGGKRLVSLLDIYGGGDATCSQCGRWQTFAALADTDAKRYLESCGWRIVIGGDDVCPKCCE